MFCKNVLGLSEYICFIREGLIWGWGDNRDITIINTVHWKLIVIDREDSRVSIYPINRTLFAFHYVQNKLFNLFLFYLLVKLERIMSKGKFLKPQRNRSLQLRLLNPLVADAVDVVTTNDKEGTGNWLAFITQ